MLTLYGAIASPFVRKVRVVLSEKSIPYQLDPVIPFNVSPEYKKISPLGKIPALRDGDRTLADSSVICAYLERTHPQPALYPSDPFDYARALWFEEYGDGGMAPVVGAKIFFPTVIAPIFFKQKPDEAAVRKAVETDLPVLFDYLESQLSEDGWLVAGRFGIGDIGIGAQLVNLRHAGVGVDAKRWPKLASFAERILARPSFKALYEEEVAGFKAAR